VNPDGVALVVDNTYRLTWSCPTLMLAGGDITVEVNAVVEDVANNAMTDPRAGTDAGGAVATLPVITLVGDAAVNVALGDAYTDAGATAVDGCAADLTGAIAVGGDTVDVNVAAVYEITYNVSDAAGNAAVEVTRTVTVIDGALPLAVTPVATIALAEGASYDWSVVASGGTGTYTYQWNRWNPDTLMFEPVVDGAFGDGAYAGADSATLSFAPFTADMAGQYQVVVSDGVDSVDAEGTVTLDVDDGVPASGALGLVALALAAALGGIGALRRRK
jgi:hypothetical protein